MLMEIGCFIVAGWSGDLPHFSQLSVCMPKKTRSAAILFV
jgi:hypothetical protein